MLASVGNPLSHVSDHAWEFTPKLFGGHVVSSQIVVMWLAGLMLVAVLIPLAARRALWPRGRGYNVVEVLVLFVRDFIARPALHERTYRYLPFLLTLFCFILVCNLMGMVPLLSISEAVGFLHRRGALIGGTPTGNIWVTGALAAMIFVVVVGSGVAAQVERFVKPGRSPVVGWTVGFFLYLWSLAPTMPAPIKLIMAPLLILLEFVGVIAKCFALAIRLFANMSAGHILLAVLAMFLAMAGDIGPLAGVVVPSSILGSVAISVLELLVAFVQAYIFTFLSALFIGLAVHPHH